MTKATLRMAMAAMADPQSKASDVARRLGMTTSEAGPLRPPPAWQRSWSLHYHRLGTPALVLEQ